LNALNSYKLQCELFEYSGEEFSTGLYEIDNIEYTYGSGGIKLEVEFVDLPIPNLNTITLGQVTGNFSVSDSSYLIGNDSSLRFEIKSLYSVDDALENEDIFPGDVQADNVGIEKEADDIIDFSENNPFGNF
jgi:hypothetical protein